MPVGFVRLIRFFRIRTSRARVPPEATLFTGKYSPLEPETARCAQVACPGVHRRAGGHSGAMGNAGRCDLSARVARYRRGAALPVGLVRIIRFFRSHEWNRSKPV